MPTLEELKKTTKTNLEDAQNNLLNNEAFDIDKSVSPTFGTSKSFDDTDITEIEIDSQSEIESSELLSSQKPIKESKSIFGGIGNYFAELKEFCKPLFSLENGLFALIIILTFYIRLGFFGNESADYSTFLKNWMQYISDKSGFDAFRYKFYDYTPLYLYFLYVGVFFKVNSLVWVKLVSVFFDYLLAYTVGKIVALKSPRLFKLTFFTALLTPAMLFNSSWWGQADVIYSTFVVGALYFILTNKIIKASVFFAIALCFKLQSIFFAPVIFFLVLTKNLSFKIFISIAALFITFYMLMVLPISQNVIFDKDARPLFDTIETKIVNGNEIKESKADGLLTTYLNQSKTYSNLAMGVPNFYQWIDNTNYNTFYRGGVILTLLMVLIIAYVIVSNKIELIDKDAIVKLSLLTTLLIPFILPKMHDRYFFLADIIAIIYAFYFPKKFWVAIVVSLVSFSVYIGGTIGAAWLPKALDREYDAMWLLGIIVYLFYDVYSYLNKFKKVDLLSD